MVKRKIVAENTILSREERRNSDEEMSYGEMVDEILVDFTPFRGALMTNILIAGIFFALMLLLWFCHENQIVRKNVLKKENIEILYKVGDRYSSAPPPPLKRDLVDEVWKNVESQQKPTNLLDNNLYNGFIVALNQQEWVKQVVEIRKTFPPHLQIVVEYRVPALIVYIPGSDGVTQDGFIEGNAVPVAEDGVVLPFQDFPEEIREGYPILRDILEPPAELRQGGSWKNRSIIVWNDDRVSCALEIVRAFGPHWKKLGLKYINVWDKHTPPYKNGKPFDLEIETHNGSIIHWNAMAQKNISNAQKAQALIKFSEEHNGLDAPGKKMNFSFRIKPRDSHNVP